MSKGSSSRKERNEESRSIPLLLECGLNCRPCKTESNVPLALCMYHLHLMWLTPDFFFNSSRPLPSFFFLELTRDSSERMTSLHSFLPTLFYLQILTVQIRSRLL